ncbi:hypothetical protein R1sor_006533 [Riccia sorocarpa]|uniref:Uncharacterized protein n=1 Tax=Riccia sorocarpa TaxID=122646 RepID=A0ABD3HMW8_9MARC
MEAMGFDRKFIQLTQENEEDWTAAFQSILQKAVVKQPGGRKKGDWTVVQILLTNCPRSIPKAQTTSGLLKAWNDAREQLRLDKEQLILEGWSPTGLYVEICLKQGWITESEAIGVRKTLRAARIDSVGRWADWALAKSEQQPLTSDETLAVEVGTRIEVQSGEISNLEWYWQSGEKKLEAWKLHTKFGKTLFTQHDRSRERQNARRWAKRFSRIWKSHLPETKKT